MIMVFWLLKKMFTKVLTCFDGEMVWTDCELILKADYVDIKHGLRL